MFAVVAVVAVVAVEVARVVVEEGGRPGRWEDVVGADLLDLSTTAVHLALPLLRAEGDLGALG